MKTNTLKLVISFILILIVSCDEPETVVTDIVHPDGSVTRKIEMKSLSNEFKASDLQVPFDTTWSVRDSIEFQGHNDTIWVKRAEKLFKNTDELNQSYIADSSGNREARRRTEFRKSFRWFHSEYRFAEIIEKRLDNGYPVSDFLNAEELKWFYSPVNLTEEMKDGSDSLKYRALNDSVNKKTDHWIMKCMVSEWTAEFLRQVGGRGGEDLSKESLKAREDRFVKLVENQGRDLDSLWNNGIILREFLGEENGKKFQREADSAASVVAERIFLNFDDYTLRMIMPGKVISSNGFVDSTGVLRWPVKSDYFMTQPYNMWAESKTTEKWAWIVTGIFLLFVSGGIIFRAMRR